MTDPERSVELFRENDVPVVGVVSNMGRSACPTCGDEHDLFPGGSPLDGLDVPVLAELPFTTEIQSTPAPGSVPDAIEALAGRVRERLDEIWNPALPDDALDLRGVPGDERHERVAEAFTALPSGDRFTMISDRDPTPVRSYLAELAGVEDPDAFPGVRVRRINPETWLLETEVP